jgi:hypothetical protein
VVVPATAPLALRANVEYNKVTGRRYPSRRPPGCLSSAVTPRPPGSPRRPGSAWLPQHPLHLCLAGQQNHSAEHRRDEEGDGGHYKNVSHGLIVAPPAVTAC